jgi:3-hydroxyacyl-CoA dehydrogenase
MEHEFKKIAVIGAGAMGVQLAALMAGAGCNVELLDKNNEAEAALKKINKTTPPALFSVNDIKRIRPGNLEDHIGRISECDWVLETIVEKSEEKRALYKRIESHVRPDALVSSNTSAIPWGILAGKEENAFRRRFLITHFFNPPRYLKLVEVVSGPDTDEKIVSKLSSFLSRRLGKGVVRAKDTPAFIANRIGVFYAMDVMHLARERGWPVEAMDEVLGRPVGRPKSGIFRLMDMVGLTAVASVAEAVLKGCPDDESIDRFRIPQYFQHMLVNGWTGNKAGCGFFMKCKESGMIKALNPMTLRYRDRIPFNTPSLEETKSIRCAKSRIRNIVFSKDEAGNIAWPIISHTLVYAANRIPEISSDIQAVDRAMRWGYNWELGPFETWDALGVREVARMLESEGREVPVLVDKLLSSGRDSFYSYNGERHAVMDLGAAINIRLPKEESRTSFAVMKKNGGVVEKNFAASLVDIGDGVFACEFHSKMNAIGNSTVKMLEISLDQVEREGVGLLIANDGEHFSVGANLMDILDAMEKKRWDDIDRMVRSFQAIGRRIRFSTKPVVSVPFRRTLGGAFEICMASAARVAHIETYMGLVERLVGLIPAGGGCLNLLLRMEQRECERREQSATLWDLPRDGGPHPKEAAAFGLIATSRTSTSACEAVDLGLLSGHDLIVYDRDNLLRDARDTLLSLAKDYLPPKPRKDIMMSGRGGETALRNTARTFASEGKATEYDVFVASKLARVLTGGDRPCVHSTDEERILELEREAFLSLVGEERTKLRIEHMLKTNKPLRN